MAAAVGFSFGASSAVHPSCRQGNGGGEVDQENNREFNITGE
jgi:hypothetical protein